MSSDPYVGNVVSLLNFSQMGDGDVVTDFRSDRQWVRVQGTGADQPSSIIQSGVLVLEDTYSTHINMLDDGGDDKTEVRDYFNGINSPKFTIEAKFTIRRVGVPSNPYIGWRDPTEARGLLGGQNGSEPSTDEINISVGDSTQGWELEEITSGLGLVVNQTIEFALQRDGGNWWMHVDGVLWITGTTDDDIILNLGPNGIRVGAYDVDLTQGISALDVYRFRMTKEVARYGSANYTPEAGNDYSTAPVATILVQPQSQTNYVGERTQFEVLVSGVGDISYQWYRQGLPVGTDSAVYPTEAAILSDNGDQIYVDVTDDVSTVSSDVATWTVIEPIDYPTDYPCPQWQYSRTANFTARRTPFDSGWTRQRRQFPQPIEQVSLTFVMSTEVFSEWYQWVEENAYGWMNFPGDRFFGSTVTEVLRFMSEIQYSYDNFNRVTASVIGEVRND